MVHALAKPSHAKDGAQGHQTPTPKTRQVSSPSTGLPLIQPKAECACGGGCPRCQNKSKIQPKLKLGAPNDRYEQEADRIASQVMGSAVSVYSHQAIPIKQDQNLFQSQSQSTTPEPISGIQPNIETKVSSPVGGTSLPTATRSFFETRFGRDLSKVRIHSGDEATALNDSIQAYAFTYQNHIWLGAGLTPEPSYLLAHELTHVIQQTEPTNLASTISSHLQTTPTLGRDYLQRFAPYWEPAHLNGRITHREVLPEISQFASLFVEAPVPNADLSSAEYGKRGSVDLYDASTTVGVYFTASQVPAWLRLSGPLRYRGNRYTHRTQAAPKPGRLQTVTDVSNAPGSIKLGDLKPSHGTIEALEGETQVRNYLEGFQLAAREVNELEDHGRADARWNPDLELFRRAQLQALIPDRYLYPATNQSPDDLVLKQNGRIIRPIIRATGKFVLYPDPIHQGILNYVWVPDLPPSFVLPARLRSLGDQVRQRIIDPLLQVPQKMPSGRVSPMLRSPIRSPRLPQPRLQRTLRDSFNLGDWRTARNQVRQQYRAVQGTADLDNARSASLVVEAHQAIENNAQINIPEPSRQTRDSSRTFDQLEFWTSRASGTFGLFRRLFGRTFVRIAAAYQKMRERFGNWLRNRRLSSVGSGLPGAAVKAIFSVMKMAGTLILNRTLDLLRDSLAEGITRKLTALIPQDNIDELQTKLTEVQQLYSQLQQQAIRSAEALVEQVFPNFSDHLSRMQQVVEVVGDITRITNLVRWGIRAVACVSPPALGCLWALGQAALERLAAVVVESCWFQEKIAPWVTRVDYVRNDLPRSLAETIIRAIQNLLPADLHDVFTEVTVRQIRPEEIQCDTSEGPGRRITDDQQAVLELQERLGEERFTALMNLLRSSGINAGVPFTRAMAERFGQFIEAEELSAADLERIARNPRGAPVELEQFLEQIRQVQERSPIDPNLPTQLSTEVSEDSEEDSPEYRTVVVAEPESELPAESSEITPSEQGHERADILEANAQASGVGSGVPVTNWSIRLLRVRDPLVEGRIVRIDLRMSRRSEDRQVIRFLRGLRTEVIEIVPSDHDPQQQEAFLEVIEDQSFSFSLRESYVYTQGIEFVYPFTPHERH